MKSSRRNALAIGGGMVAIAAGWQMFGVRPAALRFEPIVAAPGWQFAMAGEISGTSADYLTLGLDVPNDVVALPAALLDDVMFGNAHTERRVPVAVFADFFCPYCRVLTGRLAKRLAREPERVSIAWHELPLLGPNSTLAARAGVAADLQGGYERFQEVLIEEGFRPSKPYLARLAVGIGLDGARLVEDMDGAAVAAKLDRTLAAAKTLGVFATPALVVGRRVVMGALSNEMIDDLIEDAERSGSYLG